MVEKCMYEGCHRVERKCHHFIPRTIKEEMNKKASYLLRKKTSWICIKSDYLLYESWFIFHIVFAVLKRTKKSKNDLINAEEGEDHFTDISSVGEDDTQDSISYNLYYYKRPTCPTYRHKL